MIRTWIDTWLMYQILYTSGKLTHCWRRFGFQPFQEKKSSSKSDINRGKQMKHTWQFKGKGKWVTEDMYVMVYASFFSLLYIIFSRALFAVGNILSKLIGPPSWVWVGLCVSSCTRLHVCVRPNLKQVSVISPVEAPAQRELIIHTVTLFTVALWSFHFSLSLLFFPGPSGINSAPLPKALKSGLLNEFGLFSKSFGVPGGSQAQRRR